MSVTKPRRTRVKRHTGIYKSISGKYEISYRDSDGRLRFEVVGRDLQQAKEVRATRISDMSKGVPVRRTSLTFAEYADLYLEGLSHLRPRSVEAYRGNVERYLKPYFKNKRLVEITVDDVARFIAAMRRRDYASWTIASMLTPLGRIFATAERSGLVHSNPVRKLDRGERPSGSSSERRVLERAEQETLLKQAGNFAPLIGVGLYAGLRLGEVLGLQWRDIDFGAKVIHVRGQLDRNRERVEPKTSRSRRDVVLIPQLASMLRKHKVESRFSQENDFVFVAGDGTGRARTHHATMAVITRAVERAGLNGITSHCFRHTFASMLIVGAKLDVETVSRQLGHQNAHLTLTTYSHLWDSDTDAVRDSLSAAVGQVASSSS